MASGIDESRRKCGKQVCDSAGDFSVCKRLAHVQSHHPALEITRI